MPTYDFKCKHCYNLEEHEFKISELPREIQCSNCGGTMQIKIGLTKTIYKTDGFYTTDSKER